MIDFENLALNKGEHLVPLAITQLLFVRRRHQVATHIFPRLKPDVEILQVLGNGIVFIHCEVALIHAITVAIVTEIHQDRLDFIKSLFISHKREERDRKKRGCKKEMSGE